MAGLPYATPKDVHVLADQLARAQPMVVTTAKPWLQGLGAAEGPPRDPAAHTCFGFDGRACGRVRLAG